MSGIKDSISRMWNDWTGKSPDIVVIALDNNVLGRVIGLIHETLGTLDIQPVKTDSGLTLPEKLGTIRKIVLAFSYQEISADMKLLQEVSNLKKQHDKATCFLFVEKKKVEQEKPDFLCDSEVADTLQRNGAQFITTITFQQGGPHLNYAQKYTFLRWVTDSDDTTAEKPERDIIDMTAPSSKRSKGSAHQTSSVKREGLYLLSQSDDYFPLVKAAIMPILEKLDPSLQINTHLITSVYHPNLEPVQKAKMIMFIGIASERMILISEEEQDSQLGNLYFAAKGKVDMFLVLAGHIASNQLEHEVYHPSLKEQFLKNQPAIQELADNRCFISVGHYNNRPKLNGRQLQLIEEWIRKNMK